MLSRRQLQGIVRLRASLEDDMADSYEQRLEADNQIIYQIHKTLKRLNDGPTLDNLRLSERYIKGEIHIIVHLSPAGSDYVAVFQRFPEVGERNASDSRVAAFPKTGHCKTRSGDIDKWSEQRMVLVGNVQIVENPESRALSTLIRFASVNCIYSTLRYPFYFPSKSACVFLGVIKDGESGLLGWGRAVEENKLIGEVVKGASEIVDNVSNNKSDFDGRRLDVEYAVNVIPGLQIALTFESIGFATYEIIPREFQIAEVLPGAFNFYADG